MQSTNNNNNNNNNHLNNSQENKMNNEPNKNIGQHQSWIWISLRANL